MIKIFPDKLRFRRLAGEVEIENRKMPDIQIEPLFLHRSKSQNPEEHS